MEIGAFDNPKIVKKLLHSGREYKPISDGTRVHFHFVTNKCDDDKTVIDDSRKMGKPMELVIGKKFKLEVWETIVKAMAVGEVSSFKVDKSLVYSYPVIAKTLRDAAESKPQRNHLCAHTIHAVGIGYSDLDQLLKQPVDLEFTIEMLKVENPHEYLKDLWQLSESEKLESVPRLREEGNAHFKQGDILKAKLKYSAALSLLEQLMLCEKPGETEWNSLNDLTIPIMLNYAQCQFSVNEFYSVIEHCTTVLQYQPDNVKALFRRGKAHMKVWNSDEARSDLLRAAQLDPTLNSSVQSLLKQQELAIKQKDSTLKQNIKGKLFA